MAEITVDITKLSFGGQVPLGRMEYVSMQPQDRSLPKVEYQVIELDEGSVRFNADPMSHPITFVLNGLLAFVRRAGAPLCKTTALHPGDSVGGWTVGNEPIHLTTTYEGGGDVRVSWTSCRLARPRAGRADASLESVQLVGALVMVAVRRAMKR
ncbi:MAG: hypothetical protein ACHREM_00520 [Polyangiales bacterium]